MNKVCLNFSYATLKLSLPWGGKWSQTPGSAISFPETWLHNLSLTWLSGAFKEINFFCSALAIILASGWCETTYSTTPAAEIVGLQTTGDIRTVLWKSVELDFYFTSETKKDFIQIKYLKCKTFKNHFINTQTENMKNCIYNIKGYANHRL